MKHVKRLLSLLLSLSLIMLPMMQAKAAMVDNGELFGASQADRTQLIQTIQRDAVAQQLSAMGISQEQAMERIARLTDQEVAQLNQQLADLPAGGDVLGIILLIFIIFIITDALGATDIFPFVHPINR